MLRRRFCERLTAPDFILLAFIQVSGQLARMPACTQNVRKRKARQIKNDRLIAAKKAAKAKG